MFCVHNLYYQALMKEEPLKLVDGGKAQRTFCYIKDAIDAVLRIIVSFDIGISILLFITRHSYVVRTSQLFLQMC